MNQYIEAKASLSKWDVFFCPTRIQTPIVYLTSTVIKLKLSFALHLKGLEHEISQMKFGCVFFTEFSGSCCVEEHIKGCCDPSHGD